jgi:hypothetical protein
MPTSHNDLPPTERRIYASIRFGKYNLSIFDKDSVWLENTDNEGMQIWNNDVAELLDAYFTEHF